MSIISEPEGNKNNFPRFISHDFILPDISMYSVLPPHFSFPYCIQFSRFDDVLFIIPNIQNYLDGSVLKVRKKPENLGKNTRLFYKA